MLVSVMSSSRPSVILCLFCHISYHISYRISELGVCLQQEDLTSLGRVILTLANNSVHCLQNVTAAMLFVSRAYSADLKNLILSVILCICLCVGVLPIGCV